ncbi:hypothetical protein [Gordonia spumicola]|nr:hypothetical protein [Gordonia spumicola]
MTCVVLGRVASRPAVLPVYERAAVLALHRIEPSPRADSPRPEIGRRHH